LINKSKHQYFKYTDKIDKSPARIMREREKEKEWEKQAKITHTHTHTHTHTIIGWLMDYDHGVKDSYFKSVQWHWPKSSRKF
jgi:hypothetical protein